jgi:hypothetical protein
MESGDATLAILANWTCVGRNASPLDFRTIFITISRTILSTGCRKFSSRSAEGHSLQFGSSNSDALLSVPS